MYVNSGMEEVENKISQLQTHIVTLLANKLFYKWLNKCTLVNKLLFKVNKWVNNYYWLRKQII